MLQFFAGEVLEPSAVLEQLCAQLREGKPVGMIGKNRPHFFPDELRIEWHDRLPPVSSGCHDNPLQIKLSNTG